MHPLNPASLDNGLNNNISNTNTNTNTFTSKKSLNKTVKNNKNYTNTSNITNLTNDNSMINGDNQEQETPESSNNLTKITGVDDVMKSIFNQNNESINSGTIFDINQSSSINKSSINQRKLLESPQYSGEIQPINATQTNYQSQYADPNITTTISQISNTNQPNTMINTMTNTELLQKLNYTIYLLEEQRSQKSNYVTEEIILYIFLGIFIIFVLDKFSRPGKYTR
jgi:hypothetical protein